MSIKSIPTSILLAAYTSASMAALSPVTPELVAPIKQIDGVSIDHRCENLQVIYLPEKSNVGHPALLQCVMNASGTVSCKALMDFWEDYSMHPNLKGETEQIEQAIIDNCPEDAKTLTEQEALPPPKPLTFDVD